MWEKLQKEQTTSEIATKCRNCSVLTWTTSYTTKKAVERYSAKMHGNDIGYFGNFPKEDFERVFWVIGFKIQIAALNGP